MDEPHDTTPAPLGEALTEFWRRVVDRSRYRVGRAALVSRDLMEARQLRRDREAFWVRLGKTAYHLTKAGEVDHPALHKAIHRIDQVEERLRELGQAGEE